MTLRSLVVLMLLAVTLSPLRAAETSDTPLDKKTREQAIATALSFIDKEYVFPDGARKLVQAIRARQKQGAYDKIESSVALAEALTHDLRAALRDDHLGVMYSRQPLPVEDSPDHGPSPEELERMVGFGRQHNFGFVKAEILEGNIGYVRLDAFAMVAHGGDTATAAMGFIANSDALIFDLRHNHGGDPTMVQLILGYLFDGNEPVHFNDFVMRDTTKTQQFWANGWVPGKRYLGKPVYVLTSDETFSCGEEFAYDLQTQKRGTIVGEHTGGGAHPVAGHRMTEHLEVLVPYARALNPVTHTDWEGKGVQPDVPVAADKALAKALVLAAQRIAQHPRDPRHAELLQRVIKEAEATLAK
jgi:hypothetical protein